MATIIRNDNTQFVISPYREILLKNKRALLLQEIQSLADQNGHYVYFYRKTSVHYEVVFSRESGYLLGECIWNFFGKPHYLIFCEELEDKAHVLLVVVRDGSVFLDAKILKKDLQDELIPLITEQSAYRVIISGDVSLSKTKEPNKFVLPEKNINSFEILKNPLFPTLPALSAYRLKPLPLVLKEQKISRSPFLLLKLIVLAIFLMGGWWLYTANHHPVRINEHPIVRRPVFPFFALYSALKSPAPDQQLQELSNTIQHIYLMPAWGASKIRFDHGQYRIEVDVPTGGLELLAQWAKDNHFNYRIIPQGMELSVTSYLKPRTKPDEIYDTQKIMEYLIDHLDNLLAKRSVQIDGTEEKGSTKVVQLSVNMSKVSPEIIELIGEEFKNLPIVINSMDLQLNAGLIEGTIQLSVWGR